VTARGAPKARAMGLDRLREGSLPPEGDGSEAVIRVPTRGPPSAGEHVSVQVVGVGFPVGERDHRQGVQGIRVGVGDAGFLQDVSNRVVAVGLGGLGLVRTKRSTRRGQSIQGVRGKGARSDPDVVGDGGEVTTGS
jgi:hypothetical protein